jgi:hypothetical protein
MSPRTCQPVHISFLGIRGRIRRRKREKGTWNPGHSDSATLATRLYLREIEDYCCRIKSLKSD